MIVDSRHITEQILKFIKTQYQKSYMMGIQIYIFNQFCSNTGCNLFSSYQILLTYFLFSDLSLFIWTIFDRNINLDKLVYKYPQFYQQKTQKSIYSFQSFILDGGILEILIISLFNIGTGLMIIKDSISRDGQ